MICASGFVSEKYLHNWRSQRLHSVYSSKSFTVLHLVLYSLSLYFIYNIYVYNKSKFFFVYGHPIIPAQFVQKAFPSPLSYLCTSAIHRSCFWLCLSLRYNRGGKGINESWSHLDLLKILLHITPSSN